MTDTIQSQKQRWAARAAACDDLAARLIGTAQILEAPRAGEDDRAFYTQPGSIRARDAMRSRLSRANDLRRRAADATARAVSLRMLSNRNAGDAERERQRIRDASDFVTGDMTSSIWGCRRITKVNGKTVRIEGVSEPIDKSHLRMVRP